MTDSLPDPELDELVAAYLDGEATPDERARVRDDPALLARAEQLRAVSKMVAEPVVAPDAALRDAHIAAALEASSTSSVVTAMPTRRNRADLLRLASVAAVVLAIIVAVPLLVSNNDSDDDTAATEMTRADDDLAATEALATDEEDGTAAMAADDVADGGSADDSLDAGATDDGSAESAEMAPPADEEAPAEGDAESGTTDVDAALAGVPRIDIDAAASPRALRRQVERQLAAESEPAGGAEPAAPTGLACGPAIADEVSLRGPAAAVGSATVDGVVSEYVMFSEPVSVIVIFDPTTCVALFAG